MARLPPRCRGKRGGRAEAGKQESRQHARGRHRCFRLRLLPATAAAAAPSPPSSSSCAGAPPCMTAMTASQLSSWSSYPASSSSSSSSSSLLPLPDACSLLPSPSCGQAGGQGQPALSCGAEAWAAAPGRHTAGSRSSSSGASAPLRPRSPPRRCWRCRRGPGGCPPPPPPPPPRCRC